MSTISISDKPFCFVIFGASGDLAMRMLVPSLETISCYNKFHKDTKIIGVARTTFKPGELEAKYSEGIKQFSRIAPDASSPDAACELIGPFLKRFTYVSGDYSDPNTYKKLSAEIAKTNYEGVLIYFATPPTLIQPIASNLGKSGIAKHPDHWTRLIIEKPFGVDFASAVSLNKMIHTYFEEDQVFRIDHYLAKETVMNIFTLRWGNTIWEPLWNRNFISHVEIIVSESVDVGKRTGYYEGASVLRDMIQNHLLQMLSIIAMEPPSLLNSKTIRDEKMKVLHAIRDVQCNDCVLGQYIGYRELNGVKPDSTTPTLAVIRFYIDNWRWQGVPFFIISGKCLSEKTSTIKLTFNKVPHQIFGQNTIERPNVLKIRIQPNEGISLKQHVKVPGAGLVTQQIPLNFSYQDKFGDNSLSGAYERVILDAINGDQSFFPRADEIEASWKIVAPLLKEKYFVVPYAKGLDVHRGAIKRKTVIHPTRNYFTNAPEFINTSAEFLIRIIVSSVKKNGICNVALSGGNTPRPILNMLASPGYATRFDATKVHWFFVDERCVPPDHKDSNFKMVKESFFDNVKSIPEANIHRMKGEIDPQVAAQEYAKDIETHFQGQEPEFDVIVLGMGPDGHTASLFPGLPAVCDKESFVLAHFVPQVNMNRITMGSRIINHARTVLFLLQGSDKIEAFELVRNGPYIPSVLPAQVVRPKNGPLVWNILV